MNSILKGILVMCSTFLVMFVDTSTLYSQVIMPGEELLYEVSYMGITLGSIKVVTLKMKYLMERMFIIARYT